MMIPLLNLDSFSLLNELIAHKTLEAKNLSLIWEPPFKMVLLIESPFIH